MTGKLLAEAIGTFWLVLGGCGSAIFAAAYPDLGIGFLGVSLAFGLTVLSMAAAVGHISGCHLNPAVTAGLVAGGRFDAAKLPAYWLAQVVGGIAGAGVLYLVASGLPSFSAASGGFASNGYADHSPGGYPWQSSRSTPTVDGDLVYVVTPFGRLVACATADGREVFSVDLKETYGGKKGDAWGYSESVTIDGDRLICTPGAETNTMVALDKKTGTKIWSCASPEDRGAGHASVVIAKVGGRKVYVQTTASGALGVDAETGRLLWTYPIDKTTAVIPTPIVRDDLVFFSAGYKRGGALLRQVASADGVTVQEVYGLNTELANKHGGIVLVGDHLYGDSDDKGILGGLAYGAVAAGDDE